MASNEEEDLDVVFLNADEHGRNLKGHHGKDKNDLKEERWDREGRDHHRGGHCKGKKCIFAVALWFVLIAPFIRCFRKYTVACIRLHKVNKHCNEFQRSEVSKIMVARLGQPEEETTNCKRMKKLAKKAKKFAEKAKKAAEKLQKMTVQSEQKDEKVTDPQDQVIYAPPCD